MADFEFSYASGGSDARIQFLLRNPPPGFLIDPATAEIQGRPEPTSDGGIATYRTDLLAVDPVNAEHVIETIVIVVLPPLRLALALEQPFRRTVQGDGNNDGNSDGFVDVNSKTKLRLALSSPGTAAEATTANGGGGGGGGGDGSNATAVGLPQAEEVQRFFVGEVYTIAPPVVTTAKLTDSEETEVAITYTLSRNAPKTFFVQAATGLMSGRFTKPGNVQFSLIAVDETGREAVVEEHEFQVAELGQFEVTTFDRDAKLNSSIKRGFNLTDYILDETNGRTHWFAVGQVSEPLQMRTSCVRVAARTARSR